MAYRGLESQLPDGRFQVRSFRRRFGIELHLLGKHSPKVCAEVDGGSSELSWFL